MTPLPEMSTHVRELLEDVGLFQLPVIPREVCLRLGVLYGEYRYEGIAGTLIVVGSKQIIGVNASAKAPRKAFTCAHELGHYYFDVAEGVSSFSCAENDIEYSGAAGSRELRANHFAAELLMPSALFTPLIKRMEPSWDGIAALAKHCGTSMQATAQRFIDLTGHRCWLAVLRQNQLWRYSMKEGSRYHLSTKRGPMLSATPAYKWTEVPAYTWMGGAFYARRRRLAQSFLPANRYGEALVLLWDSRREFGPKPMTRLKRVFRRFLGWLLILGLLVGLAALVERWYYSQKKPTNSRAVKSHSRGHR